MKNILFRSPALTLSGYGQHSRMIARWLLSRSDLNVRFQFTPWGNTPWCVDRERFDGLIGKLLDKSVDLQSRDADVAISLCLPNEWDNTLGDVNIGMTAGVETDRCNPVWTEACNKMSAVVVPSQHAKLSLNANAIQKPVFVIPESYPTLFDSEHDIEQIDFSTDFNFLVFGQLTGDNPHNDRKNTYFTIKWLCEEFKNDPNVGIVLKTNLGRNSYVDRNQVTDLVKKLLREVRKENYPRIHLIHGDLHDKDVLSLYKNKKIKALISATRGEGFGLPLLEAARCELPIIATGWSGHLDFLKKGKFIELFYQMNDVHPSRIDNTIFMPGSRWADVQEADFKKKTRKFYLNSTIPKQWAVDLAKTIKNEYSENSINAVYNEVLKDFI